MNHAAYFQDPKNIEKIIMQENNSGVPDSEQTTRNIARIIFWICITGVVMFVAGLGILFCLKIIGDQQWFSAVIEAHFVATVRL